MNFILRFFRGQSDAALKKELRNILGFSPGNLNLYKTALTHSSLSDNVDKNNERLEFLGDAILGAFVADYLFKRYPYQGEGFLTEMRSKMVNRQQLNEVAVRMGFKKLIRYNKADFTLRSSHIFGNSLEALIGAVYLDCGYKKTCHWVFHSVILPFMHLEELESKEINHKNKLYGWANKNGKNLDFVTINESIENGRRLFTVAAMVDGETLGEGKAFNKKDASQIAANIAIALLQLPSK